MNEALLMPVASPYKSVAEELDALRAAVRAVCHGLLAQMTGEIDAIQARVDASGEEAQQQESLAAAKTPAARRRAAELLARVHDARDMLALLRTMQMQIKPAEGRRKDLKKIESVVADLRDIAARWT